MNRSPTILILAGPNGAGKTTFAREFDRKELGFKHFVNAEVIKRRFDSGIENFNTIYKTVVDEWQLLDNTDSDPTPIDWKGKK